MIDAAQLPFYSRLKAGRSRIVLPELEKTGRSEEFGDRRATIERELMLDGRRPSDEDLLIFRPLLEEGVPFLRSPSGDRAMVQLFTTPFRALDFMRTHFAERRQLAYVGMNPREAVAMFEEFDSVGITDFALDDNPRSDINATMECAEMVTPAKVVEVWAFVKSLELTQLELHTQATEELVQADELEAARELALNIVDEVTMEAGHIHFLLGRLGITLGDPILAREAREFLRYLGEESLEQALDEFEPPRGGSVH